MPGWWPGPRKGSCIRRCCRQEPRQVLPRVGVERDADQFEPLRAVLVVHLDEPGDLGLARGAPAREKVDDHRLPREPGGVEQVPVRVREGERWSGPRHGRHGRRARRGLPRLQPGLPVPVQQEGAREHHDQTEDQRHRPDPLARQPYNLHSASPIWPSLQPSMHMIANPVRRRRSRGRRRGRSMDAPTARRGIMAAQGDSI